MKAIERGSMFKGFLIRALFMRLMLERACSISLFDAPNITQTPLILLNPSSHSMSFNALLNYNFQFNTPANMSAHPSTNLNFEDDVVEVTPQVVKDAERWDRALAPPYLTHTQIIRLDDLFPVQVVDAYKRLKIAEHDLRRTEKHEDGKVANAISVVLQRLDLMADWAHCADEEVVKLRVEKRGWAGRFEGL